MRRSLTAATVVVAIVGAAIALGPSAVAWGAELSQAPAPQLDFSGVGLCEEAGGGQAVRVCYQRKILLLLEASRDPATAVPQVDSYAHSVGGVLDQECHILMHWVGRQYGVDEHVGFARLQDLLPRSNDAGCSAGFAHGLISSLGKDLLDHGPQGALAACHAAETRYRRYSCVHGLGHAYMRAYDETLVPTLAACKALGAVDAADCAAGAFHDYWLALQGADRAKAPRQPISSPRALCARQPVWAVRGCWYRALLEHPPAKIPDRARDLPSLCTGLAGLQRAGCVAGAMVVWGDDPFRQLAGCASMAALADAAACVRGVKGQALAGRPVADLVRLVTGCAAFAAAAREPCARWLGTELQVVTDGRFLTEGCPAAGGLAAACAAGARASDGALETFS